MVSLVFRLIAVALLAIACGAPASAPGSASPAANSGAPGAANPASAPAASSSGDVIAKFLALVTKDDLSYVIESSGSGMLDGEKVTLGGRGRVNGDDVEMFLGMARSRGVTVSLTTAHGKTWTRLNAQPWNESAPILASGLWLGSWRARPLTDLGIVQRVGMPFHELKVEADLTDPMPLLPEGSTITERSVSLYVRGDGTPVSAKETIVATAPGPNGPIAVTIDLNHSISALGIPQAITAPGN